MRIRNALAFKRKARKRVGDGLPQRAQTVVEANCLETPALPSSSAVRQPSARAARTCRS